tara:strand:- start:79 stop:1422 length:1344 start_codon:yes stop_codon:yes gene_type:complete
LPILYDKSWLQTNIEKKLLDEFKINISTSSNISYRILPAPHFLIKDSKLLIDDAEKQKSIAEIKNLKIFLTQGNFFNKNNINFKKLFIDDANFYLLSDDFKLLNELKNKNFSNKKIIINNSNIFFKDSLKKIISVIKVDRAILFFDENNLFNLFNLKGEIFNFPFTFNLKRKNESIKKEEINFSIKLLKLNIVNKSSKKKDNSSEGKNIISILNSKINTKYNIREKSIIFTSNNSKIGNSKTNYDGELSLNPFNLNLNIDIENYQISNLFNDNSIFVEFIKSELLFNENISINTSTVVKSSLKNKIFQKAKINFNIINGKINLNNTRFINKKIGSLELSNSNLFVENNELLLNTNVLIDIKNSDQLYSFLNTSKVSRKEIKKIFINLDYNFSNKKIEFNKLIIDKKEVSPQLLTLIKSFNVNSYSNLNKSRKLLNELLNELFYAYEG